jgi:hypothetical protein
VRLANEKCLVEFGKEPFEIRHYSAQYLEGRWHWGKHDPAGIDGYSAMVSFDERGREPKAEIIFSTDKKADVKFSTDKSGRADSLSY